MRVRVTGSIPENHSSIFLFTCIFDYLINFLSSLRLFSTPFRSTSTRSSIPLIFVYLFPGDEYFIFLLFVNGCVSVGKIKEDEIFKITSCSCLALQENSEVDACLTEVQKLLSSGSFYFSCSANGNNTFDLSLCAQRRHLQQQPDNRFFWYLQILL